MFCLLIVICGYDCISDRQPDDVLMWNTYGLLLERSGLRRSAVNALTRSLALLITLMAVIHW